MLAFPFLKTNKQQEQQQQNLLRATLPSGSHEGQVTLFTRASWSGRASSCSVLVRYWQWEIGSSERREKGMPTPHPLKIINFLPKEGNPDQELLSATRLLGHTADNTTSAPWPSSLFGPAQPLIWQCIGPRICRKPGFRSYLYLYYNSSHLWRVHYEPAIVSDTFTRIISFRPHQDPVLLM